MNICAAGGGPLCAAAFPSMPTRMTRPEEKCINMRISQNERSSRQVIYSEGSCAWSGGRRKENGSE